MAAKRNRLHNIGYSIVIIALAVIIFGAFAVHNYWVDPDVGFWLFLCLSIAAITAGTVIFFRGGPYRIQSLAVAIVSWPFSLLILIFYMMPFVIERYKVWDLALAAAGAALVVVWLPVFYTVNYIVSPKNKRKA